MVNKKLSVAILSEDLEISKDLNKIFRKINIIPNIYLNLKDFWEGINKDTPSLVIADVTSLSSGHLTFANHPLIKLEKVEVAFYYELESVALLYSCFKASNIGIIFGETNLLGQITNILKVYNKIKKVGKRLEIKTKDIIKTEMDKKYKSLISVSETFKEKDYYSKRLLDLLLLSSKFRKKTTFEEAILSFVKSVNEIDSFSLIELNQNGHKLISTFIDDDACVEIPSIWLNKHCNDGIVFYAQNLAAQVVLEILEGNIIQMLIMGDKENPDRLLFLKVRDESFYERFNWNALETNISAIFSHFQYKKKIINRNLDNQITVFDLLSLMESKSYGGKTSKLANNLELISLRFDRLILTVFSKQGGRFSWNEFYTEFIQNLSLNVDSEYKYVINNYDSIFLLVKREDIENFSCNLSEFIYKFSYWRFFENPEDILSKDLNAKMLRLPFDISTCLNIKNEVLKPKKVLDHKRIKSRANLNNYC